MKTGNIRAQRHSVTEVKRHRGTEASGRRDKLRHKETANSNGVVCNGHTCLYLFLFKWLILLFVFVGGMACSDSDHHGPASLPTGGKLVIGVDESLRPFVEAEIDVFSNDYPDAEITPLYLPEKRVVEKLLENEIQTGIICRDLSREESAYISGRYRHSPTTFKLADDRIVAVVNPANPIETISYGDLEKILSGMTVDWGQLPSTVNNNSPIRVIVPGSSSIDRHLSSSKDPFSPASIFALDTTREVIDYVGNNVRAIGIVGGSWYHRKDSLPGVKLLAFFEGDPNAESRKLRFSREVYAVTHEPVTGLGSGFISFMAGHKGQLILSKLGMTPYKPIERKIQISDAYQEW